MQIVIREKQYEFNPFADYDSLDGKMKRYVDESLDAIGKCEKENKDDLDDLPLIIDHRTSSQ